MPSFGFWFQQTLQESCKPVLVYMKWKSDRLLSFSKQAHPSSDVHVIQYTEATTPYQIITLYGTFCTATIQIVQQGLYVFMWYINLNVTSLPVHFHISSCDTLTISSHLHCGRCAAFSLFSFIFWHSVNWDCPRRLLTMFSCCSSRYCFYFFNMLFLVSNGSDSLNEWKRWEQRWLIARMIKIINGLNEVGCFKKVIFVIIRSSRSTRSQFLKS